MILIRLLTKKVMRLFSIEEITRIAFQGRSHLNIDFFYLQRERKLDQKLTRQ